MKIVLTVLFFFLLPEKNSGGLEIKSVTANTEPAFSLRIRVCWLVSHLCCTALDQGLEYGRPVFTARS